MADDKKYLINPTGTIAVSGCGLATTMLTNTLGMLFGLPYNWTALAFSCIFSGVFGIPPDVSILHKFVFFVLNSLLILSFAASINAIGPPTVKKVTEVVAAVQIQISEIIGRSQEIAKKVPDEAEQITQKASRRFFQKWF